MRLERELVLLGGLGLLILGIAWLPALVRGFPLSLPIACVTLGFVLFSNPGTGPDPNLLHEAHASGAFGDGAMACRQAKRTG